MKVHIMMASASALIFASSAVSQDMAPSVPTMSPAPMESPAPTDTTAGAEMITDPNAPSAAASTSTDSTASMTSQDSTASDPASMPGAEASATMPADPGMDATPTGQAAASVPAPDQGAMSNPALDPQKAQAADQMIAQNWSKYDAEGTGQLTPLEFGSWVLAAQGNDMSSQIKKSRQSRSANLPSTKVLNATAAEFSKADSDKDRMISRDELRNYLAG